MSDWTCGSCGASNPEGTRFCGHCGAPAGDGDVNAAASTLRSFVTTQVAERLEASGEIPEERRLITALFADISGFTPLADRLDPEELLEVIDPVVSGLSTVVARYGGYVEKYAGDALLALFGAPTSHDDDADRALLVALEMQTELARMREELPEDARGLTLHVGVNSGHGIARVLGSEARTDYAVLGDSVILAQRLESAAPTGECYVSESTYRLTRSNFELEPVGELTLKGKSEPVLAWRLVGKRSDDRREPARRMVGRERELRRLAARLDEAVAGRGSVVTIAGEPGVGKSRLTLELERHAGERGIRWLQTRCLSYGAGLAYWPYVALVRRMAGITLEMSPVNAGTRLAEAVPEAPAASFRRLLGLAGADEAVMALEPEAFRRALHSAFTDWLRGLAAAEPLALAIEDVHWADESSLVLTRELVPLAAEAPIVFVLVARPESRDELARLAGADGVGVELVPLGDAEIAALVNDLLGAPAPADVRRAVAERTEGNPFFALELIRSLQDTGTLFQQKGTWRTQPGWSAADVPPTVEEVLSARIDLLAAPAADLLQTAAVIGRRQRVALLAAVAEADGLDESLAHLVSSGLVERAVEDGEEAIVFHHALVVDVAYARLLRRRRRELHLRVAEAAEALYGTSDETIDLLARHLYLGGAGPKAVDYLVRAGRRAKLLYANEEAILDFDRAAELAPENSEILLELAGLHELVGDYEQALALYANVRDAMGGVDAWGGLAATLCKQGRYDDALGVIEQAFRTDALKGADLRPLWLERARTLVNAGHVEEAIDAAEAGLASSPARDLVAGRLLAQLAVAEDVGGGFEDALSHGLAAKEIFELERDALADLATTLRVVGGVQRELERYDEATATLRRGLTVAERVGSVEELGGCLINLGIAEFMLGHVDQAIGAERRAIEEFERVGHGSGRVTAYFNIAEMLTMTGRYDEALEIGSQALALAREMKHTLAVGAALETIALTHLRRGDFAEAAVRAEEAAELSLELGARPRARRCFELAAEAAEKAGEQERARAFRARARSLD